MASRDNGSGGGSESCLNLDEPIGWHDSLGVGGWDSTDSRFLFSFLSAGGTGGISSGLRSDALSLVDSLE